MLCYYKSIGEILVSNSLTYGAFLGSIALTSMIPEIVVGAIITLAIYSALYPAFLKKAEEVDAYQKEEAENNNDNEA